MTGTKVMGPIPAATQDVLSRELESGPSQDENPYTPMWSADIPCDVVTPVPNASPWRLMLLAIAPVLMSLLLRFSQHYLLPSDVYSPAVLLSTGMDPKAPSRCLELLATDLILCFVS